MHRRLALASALAAAVALTGCGGDDPDPAAAPSAEPSAAPSAAPSASEPAAESVSADLVGPAGEDLGTVTLEFGDDGTTVDVQASGLEPGPHGFHVHKSGTCEPDSPDPTDPAKTGDFLSAGGHLAEEGQVHGDHDGDLPSLIAGQEGAATLITTIDSLTMDNVLDEDGSAVMIHAMPDNFGNVPERYAPDGTDEMTDKTGDAGGRVACAEVTAQG